MGPLGLFSKKWASPDICVHNLARRGYTDYRKSWNQIPRTRP